MPNRFYKIFSGQCPNSTKTHSINIEYIEVTSLDSPTTYIKGRYSCPNTSDCEHTSNCPLYKNAPNSF